MIWSGCFYVLYSLHYQTRFKFLFTIICIPLVPITKRIAKEFRTKFLRYPEPIMCMAKCDYFYIWVMKAQITYSLRSHKSIAQIPTTVAFLYYYKIFMRNKVLNQNNFLVRRDILYDFIGLL